MDGGVGEGRDGRSGECDRDADDACAMRQTSCGVFRGTGCADMHQSVRPSAIR